MFKNLSDAAYSAYVDLVLTTMEHPSLMLITMTQGFWTVTLRETPLRKPDQMITRLDRLFEIACSHLIRVGLSFRNRLIVPSMKMHVFIC